MTTELSQNYDPAEVETKWYKVWEEAAVSRNIKSEKGRLQL